MRKFSEIKDTAVNALENKWGQYVGITFVFFVIEVLVSLLAYIPFIGIVVSLVSIPLGYGLMVVFLKVVRGSDNSLSDIFDGYKEFGRIFLTILIVGIYTLLWTLLLIVPGIIKAISYSMTPYVLKDNPELQYDAAITRSSRLMYGHKMDYFLFCLSFIGWYLLALLTFGIGFLWLIPYFCTAKAAFYQELIDEGKANGAQPEYSTYGPEAAEL